MKNPGLDCLSWIPRVDRVWLQNSGHHAPGGGNSAGTKFRSGANKGLGANPRPVPYFNWPHNESKPRVAPIVVSGAQVGALRNTNMGTNLHHGQVVDPRIFPNP